MEGYKAKEKNYNIKNIRKDRRLEATMPINLLSMLPILIANKCNRFSPKLRCRNKVTYRPKEKLYLAVGAKSRTAVVEIERKHTKPKVSKPIQGLTAIQ